MDTALFAFRDPDRAAQALERLVALGLPRDAVTLHRHGPRRDESETLTQLDEQVTGGAGRTLQHLFEGVFAWPGSLADPEVYRALMDAGVDERTDWVGA